MIETVGDNTTRLDRIEDDLHTIKEKMGMFDTILEGQDKMIHVVTNIQTEVAATNHGLTRHEDRITSLKKDVTHIKQKLQLV